MESCEDLAQEIFLAAFLNATRGQGIENEKSWLSRIARNVLSNHRRYQRASKRLAEELPLESEWLDSTCGPDLGWALLGPNPEVRAIERERARRLQGMVQGLPTAMRDCVEGRILDLEYREICSRLDLSLTCVKTTLHRARTRLRADMNEAIYY